MSATGPPGKGGPPPPLGGKAPAKAAGGKAGPPLGGKAPPPGKGKAPPGKGGKGSPAAASETSFPLLPSGVPDNGPRLRSVFWTVVRPTPHSIFESPMAKEAARPAPLDVAMLERKFAAVERTRLPAKDTSPAGARKTRVQILNGQTSQNLAIAFKKLPTAAQVAELLNDWRMNDLDDFQVGTLSQIVTEQKEAIEQLRQLDVADDALESAEKYLKVLGTVEALGVKTACGALLVGPAKDLPVVRRQGVVVSTSCKALRESALLLKVIFTCVQAGNLMNRGTRLASASAVVLPDALLKLEEHREQRSADEGGASSDSRGPSLLDIVVQAVVDDDPESRRPDELRKLVDALTARVNEATKVSLDESESSCNLVNKEGKKLQDSLAEIAQTDGVVRTVGKVTSIIDSTQDALSVIRIARADLLLTREWSCSNSKVASDEWWRGWSTFLEQLSRAFGRCVVRENVATPQSEARSWRSCNTPRPSPTSASTTAIFTAAPTAEAVANSPQRRLFEVVGSDQMQDDLARQHSLPSVPPLPAAATAAFRAQQSLQSVPPLAQQCSPSVPPLPVSGSKDAQLPSEAVTEADVTLVAAKPATGNVAIEERQPTSPKLPTPCRNVPKAPTPTVNDPTWREAPCRRTSWVQRQQELDDDGGQSDVSSFGGDDDEPEKPQGGAQPSMPPLDVPRVLLPNAAITSELAASPMTLQTTPTVYQQPDSEPQFNSSTIGPCPGGRPVRRRALHDRPADLSSEDEHHDLRRQQSLPAPEAARLVSAETFSPAVSPRGQIAAMTRLPAQTAADAGRASVPSQSKTDDEAQNFVSPRPSPTNRRLSTASGQDNGFETPPGSPLPTSTAQAATSRSSSRNSSQAFVSPRAVSTGCLPSSSCSQPFQTPLQESFPSEPASMPAAVPALPPSRLVASRMSGAPPARPVIDRRSSQDGAIRAAPPTAAEDLAESLDPSGSAAELVAAAQRPAVNRSGWRNWYAGRQNP